MMDYFISSLKYATLSSGWSGLNGYLSKSPSVKISLLHGFSTSLCYSSIYYWLPHVLESEHTIRVMALNILSKSISTGISAKCLNSYDFEITIGDAFKLETLKVVEFAFGFLIALLIVT